MGETPRTPMSTTTPRKGHALTCTATACATPTADGIHLCDPHEGELFALLGQIPDTLADAADTVARLDGHATTARQTATTTTGAPVNLEASARVDALQHTIADYCGRLHAAIPAAGVASADYLRRRLPDLIRQPWAGEALDQIDRGQGAVTVRCVDGVWTVTGADINTVEEHLYKLAVQLRTGEIGLEVYSATVKAELAKAGW